MIPQSIDYEASKGLVIPQSTILMQRLTMMECNASDYFDAAFDYDGTEEAGTE
jgi:hypothetical protein